MKFDIATLYVVYVNGHAYDWHLSRSAAFAARKKFEAEHAHARWTVRKASGVLVLAEV